MLIKFRIINNKRIKLIPKVKGEKIRMKIAIKIMVVVLVESYRLYFAALIWKIDKDNASVRT